MMVINPVPYLLKDVGGRIMLFIIIWLVVNNALRLLFYLTGDNKDG